MLAEGLISAGCKARTENRLADARATFAEAVAVCRSAEDQPQLARSLTGLGQIERDLGNNALALQHYCEAVGIIRTLDDPDRLAHTVRHVADILRHEHRVDEARICYGEALTIYRQRSGTKALDLANAIRGFALLNEAAGEKPAAMELWREAKNLYQSLGLDAGVQESERHLQ